MLEEIIVADAIPQQRQIQQSHGHNASYADDGKSRRTGLQRGHLCIEVAR